MSTNVPQVADKVVWKHGFPHPDWQALRALIDPSLSAPEYHWVNCQMEAQWLLLLRDHLGGDYRVHEGAQTFLLTDLPAVEARKTLAFVEQTLAKLTDALEDNADQGTSGMHIVIVISEDDDYYSYISTFSLKVTSA